MAWLELTFTLPDQEELAEIFTARLSEIGFDSFLFEEANLKAYVDEEEYRPDLIDQLLHESLFASFRLLKLEPVPDKNWNEIWESDYQPAIINERCRVRAPFHEPDSSYEFDLIIEPRMSFGTAHHETTSQIIQLMLEMDFSGKSTLDMGCGTGVLAILARKKGSFPVMAIDNDEWSYNNSLDNIVLNKVPDIRVVLGDASAIGSNRFDVVIANINRNILLEDMDSYVQAMNAGALLLLSGFYKTDLHAITEEASSVGLKYVKHLAKNQWVAAVFKK